MTVCDSGYTVKEKKVNKKRKEGNKKKGKEINTYQLRKKCINEELKKKKIQTPSPHPASPFYQ